MLKSALRERLYIERVRVCTLDRIAAHIHIQMLIGGRLSIAIRLFIHFSFFSLFNMTATYRLQLPLLIITYVIFSSQAKLVNTIEYSKQFMIILFLFRINIYCYLSLKLN